MFLAPCGGESNATPPPVPDHTADHCRRPRVAGRHGSATRERPKGHTDAFDEATRRCARRTKHGEIVGERTHLTPTEGAADHAAYIWRSRGSGLSRIQSPRKLSHITVRKMAALGKKDIHHSDARYSRPSATIRPQARRRRGYACPRKLELETALKSELLLDPVSMGGLRPWSRPPGGGSSGDSGSTAGWRVHQEVDPGSTSCLL